MDLNDIKSIIDLMNQNSISEFELEKDDFKVKLKRQSGTSADGAPSYTAIDPQPRLLPETSSAPETPVSAAPSTDPAAEITSPMIGTFYLAPSPDSEPYVAVGTEVEADSVVCIIEAMKVMNEIKAEKSGIITEILLDNGKAVEFGQTLFKIRPR